MAVTSSQVYFGLALAVVLFVQLGSVSGLKCHVCVSGAKFDGDACKSLKSEDFLVDCNVKYGNDSTFMYCRKQDQTVEGYDIVSRDCGIDGENKCVERAGTKNIRLTYCDCMKDGCNAAAGVKISLILLFLAAVSAVRNLTV